MHAVVVARVHLPDVLVGAQMVADVEDRLERVGPHVVAQHAGAVVHVEGVRPGAAEIPAFASAPAVRAVGREKRTQIAGFAAVLVEAEERRSAAALASLEAQEHQHRVAAGVVVDVAPVGVPDVADAVLAAAIAAIGQAHAGRSVRRRKREFAPVREKVLHLSRGETRPEAAGRRRFDKPARCGSLRNGRARACVHERRRHERQPATGRDEARGFPEHGSSLAITVAVAREAVGPVALAAPRQLARGQSVSGGWSRTHVDPREQVERSD